MTKPMVRIHNTETDEIIDREMTDEEFQEYTAEVETREAEESAKVDAQVKKQEVLDKLGLTAEEVASLLA